MLKKLMKDWPIFLGQQVYILSMLYPYMSNLRRGETGVLRTGKPIIIITFI